jgi:hypothetical protein
MTDTIGSVGAATGADPVQLARFIKLSSALTGYDEVALWGTGMAEEYLAALMRGAGANGDVLLTYAGDPERLFREPHLADLAGIARAVIKLWYLGQWQVGRAQGIVFSLSPQAYQAALAYPAMGGHPPGAKQPGYGSWSVPPLGAEADE